MAEKLRLTAAEIMFLLSTLDEQKRSKAPTLFGFADSERTDAVAVAGLGSLLLRGLVVADGARVQLSPDVAAVGAGLTLADRCVQIGLLAKGRSDGAVLFEAPATRFLVTPLEHRCYEVTGLDATQPLAEPLTQLVRGFLTGEQPALVSMVFGVTESPEQARTLDSITVAVDSRGRWSIARAGVAREETNLAAAEAVARFRAIVDEITPAQPVP